MLIPLITLFAVFICIALVLVLLVRKPAAQESTAALARVDALDASLRQFLASEWSRAREEARASTAELRAEVSEAIRKGDESAMLKLMEISKTQQTQMHEFTASASDSIRRLSDSIDARLASLKETLARALEGLQKDLIAKHDVMRNEASENRRTQREEIARTLQSFNEMVVGSVAQHGSTQREDLERVRLQIQQLSDSNEMRLDNVRKTVDERLQVIQNTVDEKLQETLEKRLGESFTRVAMQLEEVHKGLGEMRGLASGVTDLKKVFSNVKSRGGWGEVQLESLLEQMLSPEQYDRNVSTKEGSREAVEFAVKFPGKGETPLLLPLDAKFPIEDYQQLVDAHDRGDADAIEAAGRRLEATVKNAARTIRDKYVNPPATTDFAIMFLPTEGLYAEVLRRAGLAEQIQRECSVLIAGPTTLTAILSSLQMGFRTLAIERRSSEVWRLLESVKTEFGRFGEVVDKVNKNLDYARSHMEKLGVRTRAVTRKLRDVESLPEPDAKLLLKLAPAKGVVADDEDDAWVEASLGNEPEASA
jgi:DNA recombination protein RmuC